MSNNPLTKFNSLKGDVEDSERNLYIVAGVLGGVDLVLLFAIAALFLFIFSLKGQIRNAERERKVQEEMKAQQYTAYTGEEMHRKMMGANPSRPAESEYAFNGPYMDNRLGAPQSAASRFNRF